MEPVNKSAGSFTHPDEPAKKTPIPLRVEIVPARRAGVTGYANVGRGTPLGNPFVVGSPLDAKDSVLAFRLYLSFSQDVQHEARKLLSRDWPGGVVRLGCPCNGHEKGLPCHATVIKEYLESVIRRSQEAGE